MENEIKSEILNEEQTANIVDGKEVNASENIVLESDNASFEMPEKFAGKTAEEIAKAYTELEKMNSSKKEEEVIENNTEEIVPSEEVIKEFTEKLVNNGGEFTEENYKELEEKGYTKDFVDNYKSGVEANMAKEVSETFEKAGTTQEDFKSAAESIDWDQDRRDEFNNAINKASEIGDRNMQQVLIKSLMDYSANMPKEPITIHGNTVAANTYTGYNNKSEYHKDIASTNYKNDASYRNMVENKMIKSDRTNW